MTVIEPVHEAPTRAAASVHLTIDGQALTVPAGTLVIRAAELAGIEIPRFCDHPLLEPVGACRQCLVDVQGQRKPLASCTAAVAPDMVVNTQLTSTVAADAQRGVMELLLINHPLDCPVCDKGGECPLQNQAMSAGRTESRFTDVKRTFAKPINLSTQVLLDRERCVQCARCTRFADQIAGDHMIDLMERGAAQQIGIAEGEPFDSYYSGNTVQICPVGALTGAAYRFRARPFDLQSTPSVCEHCASGCAQRTDHRRGKVVRRLAADDPEVNEEWNCDKGRWAFHYATQPDRIREPLVRGEDGELIAASWSEALATAAAGLRRAKQQTGVLVGGRVTMEDAYAYAKFARVALGSNDIDFRARAHSAEETWFLSNRIAGRPLDVTYADMSVAPVVLLVGLEPEDESPILFLRLRKAVRSGGLPVYSIGPFASRGLTKMGGQLLAAAPGGESAVLDALHRGDVADLLRCRGAVIVVGERLSASPGALTAAARLADGTGAKLAWIPRRAGERGALEAGAFPTLLPGGRRTGHPGRDTGAIIGDAAQGHLAALVIGGVELDDLTDPQTARRALQETPFVLSLEVRESTVTRHADVVLPVAPVQEKSGTFLNWEGRQRYFAASIPDTGAMSDLRVLDALAAEMGVPLSLPDDATAREDLRRLGARPAAQSVSPPVPAPTGARPGPGQAVLSTWRELLDAGLLQDGEPFLAGTARAAVARLSPATAAEIGVAEHEKVSISTARGAITLPVKITDMTNRVVWVPMNSSGSAVNAQLGVTAGAVVNIGRAG
ncbi:NADH-quinone oxidoreductase subunit G [Mycolicibacterium frederiksbergense]|uniref:NADH-quinone oxidoreductase n=1 Tax=Mycolicibacterium frederiksbergense TaxID=117567 RepID=A0A6H0S8G8_9MYCO|nr:NADH-quinone oxidoreductase subunit G [Mycolicibacterium frederiksbergense]QIV83892.1 NADH-quinone oxidoreductase subunit G [Mycolicibacterium frederiksbergense]